MNNPTIINTKNSIDTKGLLGKEVLVADEYSYVYTPGDKVTSVYIDINILNASNSNTTISIWIVDKKKALPETIDLIESDITFSSKATYMRTNILISGSEKVCIRSDSNFVVARIVGFEDRTP